MKLSNGSAMISGKPVLALEQHPDVLWMRYDCSVTLKGGKKGFNIPRDGEMEGGLSAPRLSCRTGDNAVVFFSKQENELLRLKEG